MALYSGDVDIYKLPFMNEEKDMFLKPSVISLVHDYKSKDINNSYYKVSLEKMKK